MELDTTLTYHNYKTAKSEVFSFVLSDNRKNNQIALYDHIYKTKLDMVCNKRDPIYVKFEVALPVDVLVESVVIYSTPEKFLCTQKSLVCQVVDGITAALEGAKDELTVYVKLYDHDSGAARTGEIILGGAFSSSFAVTHGKTVVDYVEKKEMHLTTGHAVSIRLRTSVPPLGVCLYNECVVLVRNTDDFYRELRLFIRKFMLRIQAYIDAGQCGNQEEEEEVEEKKDLNKAVVDMVKADFVPTLRGLCMNIRNIGAQMYEDMDYNEWDDQTVLSTNQHQGITRGLCALNTTLANIRTCIALYKSMHKEEEQD